MTTSKANVSGKRRLRGPLLQEDLVRIIAQSIPEIAPLKGDVPKALAADTECRLREVIQKAKSYMRHAKRSHLTVEDIANAYKRRDLQPLLGYGGCGASGVEFHCVDGTSDVFIPKDTVVQLNEVISIELPPRTPEPSIEPNWVAVGGTAQFKNDKRQTRKRRRLEECGMLDDFASFARTVTYTLENAEGEASIDNTLKAVASTTTLQPVLPKFVSFIRSKVHENARPAGRTEILFNMTRFIYAIISQNGFGVDCYYDELIPALLTCLLGRRLGRGDHWELRDFAAFVVGELFELHNEQASYGRTLKTVIATLTDEHAPLESIYGVIRGLSALGEDVFQTHMLPHIPALLNGLEKAADAGCQLEDASRELVEDKIARICRVLAEVNGNPPIEDGDLMQLMEVSV